MLKIMPACVYQRTVGNFREVAFFKGKQKTRKLKLV